MNVLFEAVKKNDFDLVNHLLENGYESKINTLDKNGKSVLFYAIENLFYDGIPNANLIFLLLEYGADTNRAFDDLVHTMFTMSTLHIADKKLNDIVIALIEHGADVNQSDTLGDICCFGYYPLTTKTLLENGAILTSQTLQNFKRVLYEESRRMMNSRNPRGFKLQRLLEVKKILDKYTTKSVLKDLDGGYLSKDLYKIVSEYFDPYE